MLDPGLLLWSDSPVSEFLELVELAESLDYSEVWYTDARFDRDCYLGLALAARHSRRLLLGPGVSDPFSRHPAMIAMALATLDEVSSGRAQVGLGVGISGLAEMNIRQERPVRAIREAVEIIRRLTSGEPVDYRGELFQLQNARLGFTPVRPSIPIFVATHGRQVLRLSGSVADGVLLANMGRREAIDQAVSYIREGEVAAGRREGSVAVHLRLETCISDDEHLALTSARRRFAVRLVKTFPNWEYLEPLGVQATEAMQSAAAAGDAASVAKELPDSAVRVTSLVGSVETATAQLCELLSPAISKVTIRPLPSHWQSLAVTVQQFRNEVWPAALEGSGLA